ncbi:MAG: SDR family oxidoreductase [Roseiflexaceae bacterium]|nr:SDR family oxidoreductase [Roseiflexaceae bacterium]
MMHKQQASLLLGAIGLGIYLAARKQAAHNPFSFRGKTVVITGGSRGLGLLLGQELAQEGANLAIIARDSTEIAHAGQVLTDLGAQVVTMSGDVRDQHQVNRLIEQTITTFGRVDVLINNAGVIKAGPVEHMTVSDWEEALAVHVLGPLYSMLAVRPYMQAQGGGRIVNIASVGGKIAVPHLLPYCTSKFALVGLSDGMRVELAKDNIRVTTVCPGLMRTGSHTEAFFKGDHKQEYSWFTLLDTLPLTSIDACRAAQQIIEACRRGDSTAIISLQAQALMLLNNVLPDVVDQSLKLTNHLLPKAIGAEGDRTRVGWEI